MIYLSRPEWLQAYEEAQLETDESKLLAKVHRTETAILMRQQAIAGNSEHHEERLAMQEAISGLRSIQTDRLHFPRA
jgi:hypothetical protein